MRINEPLTFENVIDQYQTQVFRTVLGMIGNYHDAEDLSQDIFVKLYRKLDSFKGHSSFKTWLYVIVHNTVKNYLLKNKLRRMISLDWLTDETDFEIPSDALSAQEETETKETIQELNCALQKIPFQHRHVLVLREINELAYDEIATILNCSIGTVKSRLSRAKENLRRSYENAKS